MVGQRAFSSRGESALVEELQLRLKEVEEQLWQGFGRPAPVSPSAVKAILRARRQRERIFGGDLFADPAWDILLELYAAQLARAQICTSEVCRATPVPSTTALRWIGKLERAGWIRRSRDPSRSRRFFIELSESALEAMDRYFGTILGRQPEPEIDSGGRMPLMRDETLGVTDVE